MNDDWISDAAGRIFSYAIDWHEGRKTWRDEDIKNIIRHEMAENVRRALRDAQSETARPAPAGSEESEAADEDTFTQHYRLDELDHAPAGGEESEGK